MIIAHNTQIRSLIRPRYAPEDLAALARFFTAHGTLDITVKSNGLYAAVGNAAVGTSSGYDATWLRDTVMVANYFRETGQVAPVQRTVATLTRYFYTQKSRFLDIIMGGASGNDPMRRPHVRFAGDTLTEIDQPWPHAQNDALGYALWLAMRLANTGHWVPTDDDWALYAVFPLYFAAITYWADEDSGHWEETRKIESSSIGVVIAALEEMKRFLAMRGAPAVRVGPYAFTPTLLDTMIARGRTRLAAFLPHESPPMRLADGALLFLLYPMEVVDAATGAGILDNILTNLVGAHGICRYRGDSYWCADYKTLLPAAERTVDFSRDLERRDKMLKPGTEAQWFLFDPLLSVIFARKFLNTRHPQDHERQIHHFNRALALLTADDFPLGAGRCPEAYYVADSSVGAYVPNDHVPLAWSQANLGLAFHYMKTVCVE